MSKWVATTLGESCHIYQPKTISTKEMVENGPYPVYGANGVIGRYDKFNHEEPQLLVTCRGATCGAVNVSDPFSWITGNAMVIRPLSSSIDIKFLEYLFRGGIDISKSITGAAQPQITRTNLAPLAFQHPESVEEQRRIVTLLDEAFADIATAKANAEKNLQNARAMMDSELEGLFADQGQLWQEMPLSQIGQTQTGSTPKTSEPANYGDHLPFIKPGDFNIDGSLDYENEGLSALGAQSAREVTAHSVLMVCIGATIGKCGYTDQVVATNQQINALKPNAGHNPKFIYYQMLSSRFQKKVMHGSGQATLPIINKSKWSALTLRMPDPDEQTRIVKRLDDLSSQCRALESIYRQKITALDDLKKSLLHQAFSGQL